MKPNTRNKKKSNIINVDFSGVDSGRCPDGQYVATLQEWEQKTSENSGNDYINIKARLTNNATVYIMLSLSPQALWKLKEFLECIGFEVPDAAVDIDFDDFMEQQIGVIVENEEYQGRSRPKVTGFLAPDEVEETEEEEAEDTPAPKKAASNKPAAPAKSEPAPTTRRKRTPEPEPEPEAEEGEDEFEVGSKVKFDDDGKTLKGVITGEAKDGKGKAIPGTWMVKVGKDEWEIGEEDLSLQ